MSHPTRVRGLKFFRLLCVDFFNSVAPHAGAWIEICRFGAAGPCGSSHPTRVRGLKLSIYLTLLLQPRSHPTRVRGLKYLPDTAFDTRYSVAPHAGAWIEIPPTPHPYRCAASHPTRVRGLKSCPPLRHFRAVGVAPHAGAWIEIWMHRKAAPGGGCRTPRGCVD